MKTSYLFYIILVSTCLFACKKSLDTAPEDFIEPQYYYATADQMNTALAGVYDPLGKVPLYGPGANTFFGYMDNYSDIGFYIGTSRLTGVGVFNFDASDADVASLWKILYQGIDRANNLLANINTPVMDSVSRAEIKGQTLFLRSYYYFMLVSNWGDVPLRLSPTTSVDDINAVRTPAKVVYNQILQDMQQAETLVRPITYYNYSGKISKTAVEGILARVCLTMAGQPFNDKSKYQDANQWCDKVITSGIHTLNPDFKQIFINYMQDKYDIGENLWEIEFKGNGTDGTYNEYSGLGNYIGIPTTNINYGFSAGNFGTLPKLYNLYQLDPSLAATTSNPQPSLDQRRDWTISPFSLDANLNKVYFTSAQIYNRFAAKWRREYETASPKAKNYTSANFPVLRYSDVLLMKAEAENEINGPDAAAISAVNTVRRRGYGILNSGLGVNKITVSNGGTGYTSAPAVAITGGGGSGATATATVSGGKVTAVTITSKGTFYTTVPTISFTGTGTGATATATITSATDADLTSAQTQSQAAFRQAIQDERARELAFEGTRRADLKRWGLLVSAIKAAGADATANAPTAYKYTNIAGTYISDRNVYFPIPLHEISLDRALTQNPGF